METFNGNLYAAAHGVAINHKGHGNPLMKTFMQPLCENHGWQLIDFRSFIDHIVSFSDHF